MNQILKTLTEIEDWFYGSERPDVLAFDWETTGLRYLQMEPVGVSFCDGTDACYIDLWENPESKDILEFLKLVFQNGLFIAHNAKFDLKCCKKFLGIIPERVFCTYIAAFLLDENKTSHSLKSLAVLELGISQSEVKSWGIAAESGYHSEIFYKYCVNDSIWAYKIYKKYTPMLTSQELDHVFYNIEMPFVPVAMSMEINGVLIDRKALEDLEFKVKNKLI